MEEQQDRPLAGTLPKSPQSLPTPAGLPPAGASAATIPLRLQPVVAAATMAGLTAVATLLTLLGGFGGLVSYDRPPARETGFVLDINSAGPSELVQLPGVGPALAARIIERRREHGSFATLEEIREVQGIGELTLEAIRPFLRPPAAAPPEDGDGL